MNLDKSAALEILKVNPNKKPILLAFSGGPDSCFLFHTLRLHKFPFALFHLDHNAREDSYECAMFVEKLALEYQIPLFIDKLDRVPNENREDFWRNQRRDRIYAICKREKLPFCALGHQMDDQAETVLKRFFEGSSLFSMGGIKRVSRVKEVTYLRPLLGMKKSLLVQWLDEKGFTYRIDSSNDTSAFLRNRLRTQFFPFAKEIFGKELIAPLAKSANDFLELVEYLDDRTKSLGKVRRTDKGWRLDLKGVEFSYFEAKYLIHNLLKEYSITFSKDQLNAASKALANGDANKRFLQKGACLLIDRQCASFEKDCEI